MANTASYVPISHDANGVTTEFPFTFLILSENDVVVILEDGTGNQTTLMKGTHYSVSFSSDTTGGSITTVSTYDSPYKIIIARERDYKQGVKLSTTNGFGSGTIENEIADSLSMQVQQLQEQLDRCLKFVVGSGVTAKSLPSPEAQKLVRWNLEGTGLENVPLESGHTHANLVAVESVAADYNDLTATINKLDLAADRKPLIVAHRGGTKYFAENTMSTFRQCEQLGVDGVEVDVQFSSDDTAFILHDLGSDALRRTTDGIGQLNAYTAAQLDTLDAGSYKTGWTLCHIADDTTVHANLSASQCWNYGISYTPTPLDITDEKHLYIGVDWDFKGIDIGIDAIGAGYTLKVEYYNEDGNWVDVPDLIDNTNNLAQSGSITFDIPQKSWRKSIMDYVAKYHIRISTITTPTQTAEMKYCRNISDVRDCSNAGDRIPRLNDFLDWFAASNLKIVNLHIKQCDNSTHADLITNAIVSRGLIDRVILYMDSEAHITLIRNSNPDIQMLHTTTISTALSSTVKPNWGWLFEYHDFLNNIETVKTLRTQDYKIGVWNISNVYLVPTGTGTTRLYTVCKQYADIVDFALVEQPESKDLVSDIRWSGVELASGLNSFSPAKQAKPVSMFTESGDVYARKDAETTHYEVLPNNTDYIYIQVSKDADDSPYTSTVSFDIDTPAVGASLAAEYLDDQGNWQALSITDGTSNLTVDGSISFAPPADWGYRYVETKVLSVIYKGYWVRIKSTSTPTTPATCLIAYNNNCIAINNANSVYILDDTQGSTSKIYTAIPVTPGEIIRVSADIKTISGSPGISLHYVYPGNLCFTEASGNYYRRYEAIALIPPGVHYINVDIGSTTDRVAECHVKNPLIEKISLPISNVPSTLGAAASTKIIAACMIRIVSGVPEIHDTYTNVNVQSVNMLDNYTMLIELNQLYNTPLPLPMATPDVANMQGGIFYAPAIGGYSGNDRKFAVSILKQENGVAFGYADITTLNYVYFTFAALRA